MDIDYSKYIKYKQKYLNLSNNNNQLYGGNPNFLNISGASVDIDMNDNTTIENVKRQISDIKHFDYWFLIRIIDDYDILNDKDKTIDLLNKSLYYVIPDIEPDIIPLLEAIKYNRFNDIENYLSIFPLPDILRENKQFLLYLIKNWSTLFSLDLLYNIIPFEFKNDMLFMLEVFSCNGALLRYASDNLKSNKEIVLAAVKSNGSVFQYVDYSLRSDRMVVLEAIKTYGISIRYASDDIKEDKDIVLEAVKRNGHVLRYINDDLIRDKDVVLEAVKNIGNALQYASLELRGDRDVVLEAVKRDGNALKYATYELRRDTDLILEANKTAFIQY